MTYPAGIDVSSYQSATYDTSGMAFVFVKATEGTGYTNPLYGAQVSHGRLGGLVIGHYHYLRPGDVQAQADYFLSHVQIAPGDVIALDWEASGSTQADRDNWIHYVKGKMPAARVVLYCNKDFWLAIDTESYAGDGLWIADPDSPAGSPGIQAPWVFHQYSSADGIDRNVANFASTAALRKWAGMSADPAGTGGAAAIIATAEREVGYHEGRDASGDWDNIQKYSEQVPGLAWSDGQPWCATFVSWCAMVSGNAALYPRTASCAAGVEWFRSIGRFSEYPAIGAQVFYGNGGGDHTGIVARFDDTYIYTVEGNANDNGSAEGDGVYEKQRVRRDAYVYGYGYPKFATGIKSADPAYGGKPARPNVSLAHVIDAAQTDPSAAQGHQSHPVDVRPVEDALCREGLLDKAHAYDGSFGSLSVKAYAAWQRRCGFSGADANGIPGRKTLTALGNKYGFTVS
ncbi:GH25 family lysozyme [Streptomyces noursei]|uniref:GH25 family lysozyme n=1 Tax=Streptomyces noursei TaxID=1971 RepID=UPI003813495F